MPRLAITDMNERAVYLCPSDRAARAFQALFSVRDAAPPTCVDVERFCRELWQRGRLFGLIDDARELLDPATAAAMWQHALREEGSFSEPEIARVSTSLGDAWALVHRYQFPLASLAAMTVGNDNVALFARCARRMQSLLKQKRGLTPAELPLTLVGLLELLRPLLPARVVVTPAFASNTAHLRLLTAMARLGVQVDSWSEPAMQRAQPSVRRFADARQEMNAAIAWARDWALANDATRASSGSTVAIVVPGLSSTRGVWLDALRAALNADRWWLDPESDRHRFNLSIGLRLADYPHINCLTVVLRSVHTVVDSEVLAQALAHSRWGRNPASIRRIEQRQWELLERGIDQSMLVDWLDVMPTAVRQCAALFPDAHDKEVRRPRATLALNLNDAVKGLTEHAMIPTSELFQLEESWADTVKRWAQRDRWLPAVSWREAIREFAQLADDQTFQPRSGRAPIQVVGLLESAGVPFAAAWIVGLTDRVLPESFKPNPMLPMAWQAANHVGLGSRDEVRRRAVAMWTNWRSLTDSLQVSFASESDDGVQRLSVLAASLPVTDHGAAGHAVAQSDRPVASARALTRVTDELLPVVTASTGIRGTLSSSDVERQAQCPRRAAAAFMRLDEWPEHVVGLSPRVRGTLAHEVMAAIGEARRHGVVDGSGEPDLDMLRRVASEAFTRAVVIEAKKRTRVPAAIWDIERARLLPLIDQVLVLDAARDGFRVVNVEEDVKASLFGAVFKLRVDRVDDFAAAKDESEQYGVVLDYKTGGVSRTDWFAQNSSGRLAAPQLPLYMFALNAIMPPDVPRIGAIGYIIISDDDVKFVGLGADASLNTKRVGKDEPDWFELTLQWREQLAALVDEIQTGVAAVAPLKGRATCRYCGMASFCREPWSLSGSGVADVDVPDGGEPASAA